ncbi:lysylphosphatidylglycerol synthase domain-containing protein [Streptosporangium sp. NPDC023963]|uniref:lysylphosphatidylglycerol synthase domain-containing protein n=1 Tax=Streptosporangium sp. NPDC023963 TaxID=3155608 RepID=UPI003432192A
MTESRPWRPWRPSWRLPRALVRALIAAFALVLVGAVAAALAGQDWSVVSVMLARSDGGRIGLLLAGALLTSMAGLGFGYLAWRAVLFELGPRVGEPRVARVFFVTFLSKYVPGKVPGLIAATKVATANGVGLGRLMGTAALSMSLVLLTGLTIGLLAGVHMIGTQVAWLVAVAAVLIVVVLVRPQLVNHGAQLVLRVLRRPDPARSASPRGIRFAVVAQAVSWLVTGLHLWLLAVAMGADPLRSLGLCVGAFTLATTVGMLTVVLPDGIGVREAVLTAALTVVLPAPAAAVVAVASRLVSTVAEVALGAAALAVAEVVIRRTPAAASKPDPELTADPEPATAREPATVAESAPVAGDK